MIPFSELQKQADKVAEVTGKHVSVSITYDVFDTGEVELQYSFYTNQPPLHHYFKTVQELQQAMENIINPPVDEGVEVER